MEDNKNLNQEPTEVTNVQPVVSRGQSEESKERQADSMRSKWQDPVYKARVTKGRCTKKIAKLLGEIAAETEKQDTLINEDAVTLSKKKVEKLEAQVADTKEKLKGALETLGEDFDEVVDAIAPIAPVVSSENVVAENTAPVEADSDNAEDGTEE